jgi:peptidyl-prolyl cis-trans isomerase C
MLFQMKRVQFSWRRCLAIFVFSICFFGAGGAVAETAFGSSSRSSPSSAVVATVNNTPITQADIDAAIAVAGGQDTIEQRRAMRYHLIALELLRQAATQSHYMNLDTGARGRTQAERSIAAIQLYLRDVVRPAPVTDADVSVRYGEIVSGLGALRERRGNGARDVDATGMPILLEQYGLDAGAAWNIGIQDKTSQGDVLHTELGVPIGKECNRNGKQLTKVELRSCFVSGLSTTRSSRYNDHGFPRFNAVGLAEDLRVEALVDKIRQQLETERLNEAIRAVVEDLMARANISE